MTTNMEVKTLGSYPKSGIDVLIVGGGLGGLTAALECTRKGHNVTMLERDSQINTSGDMYFMGLSATRFFNHWPEIAEQYAANSLHNAWMQSYKHSGEMMIPPMKVSERLKAQGLDPSTPPGNFQMRPQIYKMFIDQVQKLGIPIHFNQRVVEYFEDEEKGKGGVVTQEGKRYEADVVIAADGVGSKSQKMVGGEVKARSSSRAMWRACFDPKYLEKNPEVKEYFGMHNGEPIIRTFLGPGTYGLTLSREDVMVWIINHHATRSSEENWNKTINQDEVLAGLNEVPGGQPWGKALQDLVKCTPENGIVNFELLWRNPQQKWASPGARVIQIGDCAHSYLPSSGNGATQAIEDSVSLASCLQIGGKENIPQSVRAHVRMRFVRNACAQYLGFANAELLMATDWTKAKIDPKMAQPRHPKWVWAHDPEAYAYETYDKIVESMNKGVALEDDESVPPNYPPGYHYKPWDIDEIMEGLSRGQGVDLSPGDWS